MNLESLLAFSAVCKTFTEMILGGIKTKITVTNPDGTIKWLIKPDTWSWISLIISILVAVIANEGAGFNILTGSGFASRVSSDGGILITGFFIGFGSNIVNELFNIVQGWGDKARTVTATTTATVETSGSTEGNATASVFSK